MQNTGHDDLTNHSLDITHSSIPSHLNWIDVLLGGFGFYLIERLISKGWIGEDFNSSLQMESYLLFTCLYLAFLYGGLVYGSTLLNRLSSSLLKKGIYSLTGATLGGIGFFWMSKDLLSGKWVSQQDWVNSLEFALIGTGVLGGSLYPALIRFLNQYRPWYRTISLLSWILGISGLIINHMVLPGLYLSFHQGMIALSFIVWMQGCIYTKKRFLISQSSYSATSPLTSTLKTSSPTPLISLYRHKYTSYLCLCLFILCGLSFQYTSNKTLSQIEAEFPAWYAYTALFNSSKTVHHSLDLLSSHHQNRLNRDRLTSSRPKTHPKIDSAILIIVDTLRADVVPPLRKTSHPWIKSSDTPFLNTWIPKTYHFSQAYAQSSQTRISVPSLFRSLNPFEDAKKYGYPLSQEMKRLGKKTLALIPQYFVISEEKRTRHLVEHFDAMTIINKPKQDRMIPEFKKLIQKEVLEGAKSPRPFFTWMHLYCMHDPYFAGKLTTSKDGSRQHRYRSALQWLDRQLAELKKYLKEKGLDQTTAIILTSDHGEFVSPRKVGHGMGVSEIETRIPLWVDVPHLSGGRRDQLVGNLDVIPTLLDLFGTEPKVYHRGRSLVPLFLNPQAEWDFAYPLRNGKYTEEGVVYNHHKLIYSTKSKRFKVYNLKKDPSERDDLFDEKSPQVHELMQHLLEMTPSSFKKQIHHFFKDPTPLLEKIQALKESNQLPWVEYLLKLTLELKSASFSSTSNQSASHPSNPSVSSIRYSTFLKAFESYFQKTKSPQHQALIFHHLQSQNPKRWNDLITQIFKKHSSFKESHTLITHLAHYPTQSFAQMWLIKQWSVVATLPLSEWQPWLLLTSSWRKNQNWKTPLRKLITVFDTQFQSQRPFSHPQWEVLRLLLMQIKSLKHHGLSFQDWLTPYLNHSVSMIRSVAIEAYVAIRAKDASQTLRTLLTQDPKKMDVRTKESILKGIMHLEGEKSIPLLIEAGQDAQVLLDMISLLKKLGSPKALPFLKKIAKKHYNRYTRQSAKQAVKSIQRKLRRKKSSFSKRASKKHSKKLQKTRLLQKNTQKSTSKKKES